MLDSTTVLEKLEAFAASPPPVPDKITGNYLARNRLPSEARVALALRLSRGDEPVTGFTVAQACRLARVPRSKVDRQLGRHRSVGDAMARAFQRALTKDRISFVRSIGAEAVWAALSQAL